MEKIIDNNISRKISIENSNRIKITKVILTFLVIVLHMYGNTVNTSSGTFAYNTTPLIENIQFFVCRYICSCAVPGFFLISGYLLFYKPFNVWSNIKKKAKSVLIPFIIVNTLGILICCIGSRIPYFSLLCGEDYWQLKGIKNVVEAFIGIFRGYPFVYPLWFLRDLFILNLFAYPVYYVCKKTPVLTFVFFLLGAIFIGGRYVFFFNLISLWFWGLGGTIALCKTKPIAISFPTLHTYWRELLPKRRRNVKIYFGVIGIIWLFTGFIVLLGNRSAMLKDSSLLDSVLQNIGAILGLLFFWTGSHILVNSAQILSAVERISPYVFWVYLFHEKTLTAIRRILVRLLPDSSTVYILIFVLLPIVLFAMLLIVARIVRKNFPKIYKVIVGKRM